MEMIRLETPPELDMPIGEAMFTQRAIRRLDPHRPISQAHLKVLLDAASKAPSGGNTQPARFLVVRDKERIREFREAVSRSLVGEAPGRVRMDGQGGHPARLRLRDAVAACRRDRGCSGDHPRAVGGCAAVRALGISAGAEPPARGACAWNRIGADDAAPAGDGAGVRDVRDSSGGRVPLLHSPRVSEGKVRTDEEVPDGGNDELGALERKTAMGVTPTAVSSWCKSEGAEVDSCVRPCAGERTASVGRFSSPSRLVPRSPTWFPSPGGPPSPQSSPWSWPSALRARRGVWRLRVFRFS